MIGEISAWSMGKSTPFIEFMLKIILTTLKQIKEKNVPLKRLDEIIKLIKKDTLVRVGSLKAGHWEIMAR